MASSISATSATFRAIGPFIASVLKGSRRGPCGTTPGPGRNPTVDVKLVGIRMEPPWSLPVASQTCPAASAAAEPPEEPPGVSVVFQGFVVVPNTSLNVCEPAPNSGVLDLATTRAPFVSSRSTI